MDNLNHKTEELKTGGFVLVLDTGAIIDPQAQAMIQALHSRSTGGIYKHLEVLKDKGAEKFMQSFYVGYGHKSIGDCASCTVFVEGISMLAAKAIQDWRLYSGQESSTRYIDFSKQAFFDPLNTEYSKKILEDWREFYLQIKEPLQQHLKIQNPINEGEKENIYDKAIAARGFDIARAFLPAGATTNIAWTMNFRQLADELALLRHHPLDEVKDISIKTEIALKKSFPESFCHEIFETTENYNKQIMEEYYYTNNGAKNFTYIHNGLDTDLLKKYEKLLQSRPMKTELPPAIAECGTLTYEFLLDFGSFRDLQRHRAIIQRMPLLTQNHGFHEWYVDSLPPSLQEEAINFIASQKEKINSLQCSDEIKQYYTPMGYKVPCRVIGNLKALIYLVELRSTRFVHPTLVEQMLKMIADLEYRLSDYGLLIHKDDEPNRFDVRRGEQDIVAK